MAEDRTPEPAPRERLDKAARQIERQRINRLSRLPFLYDFALQGRAQAVLAASLSGVLILAAVLVPARALTGEWLPPFIGFVVLAAGFALQATNRYLNAKAGRT